MKNAFEKFANERLTRAQQDIVKGGNAETEEDCSFWDKVRDTARKYLSPVTEESGTGDDVKTPCAA